MPATTPNTFKRFGIEWSHNRDGWGGVYKERFLLVTWRFGDIWQSCLEIHDKPVDESDHHAWMCLNPQKTMNAAMKHAKAYADNYQPTTVEEVFSWCFANYKSLYRTRRDVINHLFFVIGNGYDWVDGTIISTSEPEPKLSPEEEKKRRDERRGITADSFNEIYDMMDAQEAALPIGPITEQEYHEEKKRNRFAFGMPKCEHPRRLYGVCHYSNIWVVPDNVRPDWLAISYEAAKMLAAETFCEHCPTEFICKDNPEIGARIVKELETRFPQLLASTEEPVTTNA